MIQIVLLIYVFLYQNLNKKEEKSEVKVEGIYVFLYQNLNIDEKLEATKFATFMYFYIRI